MVSRITRRRFIAGAAAATVAAVLLPVHQRRKDPSPRIGGVRDTRRDNLVGAGDDGSEPPSVTVTSSPPGNNGRLESPNLTVRSSPSGDSLTWDAVNGASAYEVWRSTTDPYTGFSLVASPRTTSYEDTSGVAGRPVWYRVAAAGGNPSNARVGGKLATKGASPIVPGRLTASVEIHSIDLELTVSGDSDNSAQYLIEYKKQSDTTWRSFYPLWRARTSPSTQQSFHTSVYGSIMFLDPNTTYDVVVIIRDPGGITGSHTLTTTATTRTNTNQSASAAAPTHYVDSINGDDSWTGTSDTLVSSATGPWKTLDKAISSANSASADMVIQLARGYYLHTGTWLNGSSKHRITLQCQFPAVDDNGEIINVGDHTVIEAYRGSRPDGSASTGDNTGLTEGPWTNLISIGTYTIPDASLYFWEGSPVAAPNQLGYGTTRADAPQRIAWWKVDSGWDDEQRIRFMFQNDTYEYGFMPNQAGTGTYLRLPPNAPSQNPNTLYITFGSPPLLTVNGLSETTPSETEGRIHRISGFEWRTSFSGIECEGYARKLQIDHNLFISCKNGVYWKTNADTTPASMPTDVVVERNRFIDSNLRATKGSDWSYGVGMIPWTFIKSGSEGGGASNGRTGEENETNAIGGSRGALRSVIRYNVVDGPFNAFMNYAAADARAMQGTDAYHNVIRNINDDAFENEPHGICFKIWENHVENALVFLSLATNNYGPCYVISNRGWHFSVTEGPSTKAGTKDGSPLIYKLSSAHDYQPMVYTANNTFFTDEINMTFPSKGWQFTNNGANQYGPLFTSANDIVRVYFRVMEFDTGSIVIEDYNFYAAGIDDLAGAPGGIKLSGALNYQQPAETVDYRSETGGGEHTNLVDGATYGFGGSGATFLDAELPMISTGNFALRAGSMLLAAGKPHYGPTDDLSSVRLGYVATKVI